MRSDEEKREIKGTINTKVEERSTEVNLSLWKMGWGRKRDEKVEVAVKS